MTGHERYLPTPVLGDPRRLDFPWREDYQGERFRVQHPDLAKPFVETAAPTQWLHSQDGTPLRLGFCSGLITDVGHSVMSASFPDYSRPPPHAKDAAAYEALPAEPHREADPAGCPTYHFFRRQDYAHPGTAAHSQQALARAHPASGTGLTARNRTQRVSTGAGMGAGAGATQQLPALTRSVTSRITHPHAQTHAQTQYAAPPVSMPGSRLTPSSATAQAALPSAPAPADAHAHAHAHAYTPTGPSASSSAAFATAVIKQHRAAAGPDDTFYRPLSIQQAQASAPGLARRAHPAARAFGVGAAAAAAQLQQQQRRRPDMNATSSANTLSRDFTAAQFTSPSLDPTEAPAPSAHTQALAAALEPHRTALRADDSAVVRARTQRRNRTLLELAREQQLQLGETALGSLSGTRRSRLEAATTAYGATFSAPAPGLHYH
jgi:hypothetical protein